MFKSLPSEILTEKEFNEQAIALFKHQAKHVPIYRDFIQQLNRTGLIKTIEDVGEIPFLPISFFKSHEVIPTDLKVEAVFESSGTTGDITSKHFVHDLNVYHQAHRIGFQGAYGNIEDYTVLALLPSYLERSGSSLVMMVDDMIKRSSKKESGFYLHNLEELRGKLMLLNKGNEKVLLIGVSYALLDLIDLGSLQLSNTIVMETGGMKGKRKELVKEELHQILQEGFGVNAIHSEYGMTELLSQAYSKGDGLFGVSPTMQVFIRDVNDPFTILPNGYSGGINVIDLANTYSCAFIATQDLGKKLNESAFQVLGRFDHSDVRGCNLMVGD
jgi:phenylacetate-coenzyme A ligase PaaK-like adenylate-forming protein